MLTTRRSMYLWFCRGERVSQSGVILSHTSCAATNMGQEKVLYLLGISEVAGMADSSLQNVASCNERKRVKHSMRGQKSP